MSYFARDDVKRHPSPNRKQGKQTGGPIAYPAPTNLMTRDDIIAQNVESMQPKDDPKGVNGGVMRYIRDSESHHIRARNIHTKPDSDIFGPPVLAPQPKPRIRVGVSDEELAKIWHEDEKKVKAAQAMERAPNLVEKMVAEPPPLSIVSPRPKDAVAPPRRHIDLMTQTAHIKAKEANEPAGFSGMGQNCRVSAPQGRMCKPVDEFVPPELKLKPRDGGRRTRFPKDTFSFQDDNQTL
jgi:hypothetical protein